MTFEERHKTASRALPPALILGLGVHGLAIARSLGRRGVAVEAVDSDARQPHRHSRYCQRLHEVGSLEDERLLKFLIGFGRQRGRRTALFITMDRTVPIVSAHRHILQEYFDFTLAPEAVIKELMDKTRLPGFLERCGTQHPRTVWMRGSQDLAAVGETVGFPCVVKPALRTYGFKASIVRSSEELAEVYSQASRHSDKLVAQQWVPGRDSDVYFCFAYIGKDGNPKGLFVGHKLRQYPSGTGIAAEAAGCDDEFIRQETLKLFQLPGYKGFGSTEFRRDPVSGEYFFIEFTVGRTDYNVGCAIANGVDLPFLGYCDTVGLRAQVDLPRQRNSRRWVDLGRNVNAILAERRKQGGARLRAMASVAACLSPRNAFTLFDAGDMRPLLIHMGHRATAVPRAIHRKVLALFNAAAGC